MADDGENEDAVELTGNVVEAISIALGGSVGIRACKLRRKEPRTRGRLKSVSVRPDAADDGESSDDDQVGPLLGAFVNVAMDESL